MTKSVLLASMVLVAATLASAQPQSQPGTDAELLRKLASEVEMLKKRAVPTGAVMGFDLESCPSGWREYAPAPPTAAAGFPPPMPGFQGCMPPFMAMRMCQKE